MGASALQKPCCHLHVTQQRLKVRSQEQKKRKACTNYLEKRWAMEGSPFLAFWPIPFMWREHPTPYRDSSSHAFIPSARAGHRTRPIMVEPKSRLEKALFEKLSETSKRQRSAQLCLSATCYVHGSAARRHLILQPTAMVHEFCCFCVGGGGGGCAPLSQLASRPVGQSHLRQCSVTHSLKEKYLLCKHGIELRSTWAPYHLS